MSLCDPQIEGLPKSADSIEFPRCCNSLFSQNTRLNFSFNSQSEALNLQKNTTLKNRWFCLLRFNPHSPKFLKNAIIIDISRCSNWRFSKIAGLSSSIKILYRKFTLVDDDSIENRWYWSLHQNLDSPKLPESCFQKCFIPFIETCYSVTTGLISFMRVTFNKYTPGEKDLNRITVSWFFCIKIRMLSKIESIFIDWCLHSTSYFPVTTGLISSSKVSIKSLTTLEESSIRNFLILTFASKSW